ncbi:phosphatase PAP2 family protein [Dehalococcoidia bacterium]|nr:phosphatase PAP2 family protein [Dehalococcoidia bacterium]
MMKSDNRGWPRQLSIALAQRGRDQRWAVGIAVLVALAVALAVAVGNSGLLPAEQVVTQWFHDNAGGPGRYVSNVLDVAMGKELAPVLFLALLLLVWWAWGRFAMAAFVLAGLSSTVTFVDLVSRPKPSPDFTLGNVIHGEAGYPSGHVAFAVIILGMLAFLANRYGYPSMRRSMLAWALLIVVMLMGPSRLIERDHWPADVIGGYLIGLSLLLVTIWLHNHALLWIGPRYPRLCSLLTGDSALGLDEVPSA